MARDTGVALHTGSEYVVVLPDGSEEAVSHRRFVDEQPGIGYQAVILFRFASGRVMYFRRKDILVRKVSDA